MRILIAGIGNIFFGDDAFGSEVARALMRCQLPSKVRVEDYGIRSYDLAYAIMDGYDAVVLVDAAPRGEPPGTLSLVEPDLQSLSEQPNEILNAHGMSPMLVLRMVEALGGTMPTLYLVACEPAILEADEIGLSPTIQGAIPRAAEMIQELAQRLLEGKPPVLVTG